MTTSGALCKGYGGLELAAEAILGPLEHLWYAENDPHASIVCAARWPGVPNLGDLTAVDWTTVPPVDVLTAGYPCQGESLAGKRRGVNDERWIWEHVFAAIRDLRPRLVLLENVAGHLSLGFGRVLGDLASAGFDAEWGCFRASDVGAPHRRERVFIAAWPADTPRPGLEGRREGRAGGVPAGEGGVSLLPTPTVADSRGSRNATARRTAIKPTTSLGWTLSDIAYAGVLLPTPRTVNSKSGRAMEASRDNGRRSGGGQSSPPGLEEIAQLMAGEWPSHMPPADRLPESTRRLLPTPMAADGGSDRASSAGFGLRDTSRKIPDQWGAYAPAIARWEAITGRSAPSPTEPGAKGQPRLAPPFVEWLMGLPAGWVTGHIGRGQALKCLGNGVVWQQAAHAYTQLLVAS